MSFFKRVRDLVSSNVNSALDKVEDPSKMVDQMIRDLHSELNTVKASTASILAESKSAERQVNELREEIVKFEGYAKKAVQAGNDSDAKAFLERKNETALKLGEAERRLAMCESNANAAKKEYERLNKEVAKLEERKRDIKAKVSQAKTQEKINELTSKNVGAPSLSKFNEMEDKANRMVDEAMASMELSAEPVDETEDLMSKYDSQPLDSNVDDELKALKESMSL